MGRPAFELASVTRAKDEEEERRSQEDNKRPRLEEEEEEEAVEPEVSARATIKKNPILTDSF